MIAHHTAYVATADAARHRAVFNVAAKAPSRHAADERATCYVYFCQHHVLHRAFDEAEQTRISVTSRNGQPRDGLAIAVEGAGVCFVIIFAYRCPVDALQVDVGRQGDIDA